MTSRHLPLTVLLLALFVGVALCETSKFTALQSIAAKIQAMSSTRPRSNKPEKQTDPALAQLSSEELKRLKALDFKLQGLSISLISLTKILQKDRLRKMRDGRTAIDHLRDIYGKLKQLEPQFRAFGDRLPAAMQIDDLKLLEKQLKLILEDEEKAGKAIVASKELQKKVERKAKKKEIPRGIYGAQCGPGPCCHAVRFRFLPQGTGCKAGECVEAMTCIGNSEICPSGKPLPDGTSCSKGRCLSGVCINEAKLVTASDSSKACTEGPCCDLEKGAFRPQGAACDVPEELCVEPAAFCSGSSALCETTPKPEDTLCLVGADKGGNCKKGVCVESPEEDVSNLFSKEKQSNAEKRRLISKRHDELKRLKKQKKEREMKHLVRRFGVLMWMNNKIDSLDADQKVADYLVAVPGSPSVSQIFEHHRVPTESNKLWSAYFSENTDDSATARGVPITTLIDPSANGTATAAAKSSLQSGNGAASASSYLGIGLIGIALILIVCYLVFGNKKKKKDPQVVY